MKTGLVEESEVWKIRNALFWEGNRKKECSQSRRIDGKHLGEDGQVHGSCVWSGCAQESHKVPLPDTVLLCRMCQLWLVVPEGHMAGTCFEEHVSWRVLCGRQTRQMAACSTLGRSAFPTLAAWVSQAEIHQVYTKLRGKVCCSPPLGRCDARGVSAKLS